VPKLPTARPGTILKLKGAKTEFSWFPTYRGERRAGVHTKVYTTDAWSVIHANTRRISPKRLRMSAIAFGEQANEFYSAAIAASTIRARPLLLYYAFLNLAKALCLCRGNTRAVGPAMHGLQERANTGRGLRFAKVKAVPSVPHKVSMFDEFLEAVGDARLVAEQVFRVRDLVAGSLIGHRLWCEAANRSDRFLRLRRIRVMHDAIGKRVWLRATMRRGSRSRSHISSSDIGKRGFDGAWAQVALPGSASSELLCWEQKTPTSYSGRPSDRLEHLISSTRSTLYRALTVAEPFRSYYIYVPPQGFRKHHQMATRYMLLFVLGSITRYHPADFDAYLSGEFGPFISEFLASEPSQMLFEMACMFARREVVSVGLA
jgi:YaaC-like Protein